MSRLFRYSSTRYATLAANPPHTFAQQHALNIYRSEAIYSFIPKNACSTMRTTLAIANGCIRDGRDFNWIHQNNATFAASLAELARAKYTFTILRCPFARLLSVYLDKFLNRNPVAWRYIDMHRRGIEMRDITFEYFVRSMCKASIRGGDIHWMPQVSFLVYERYDDYFAVEDMPHLVHTLKDRIDLDVVDARPLTRHGATGYRKLRKAQPFRLSPLELLNHKERGALPGIEAMYNDDLVDCVRRAYKSDIALYKRVLDRKHLFAD